MDDTPTATSAWRVERRATPWLANAVAGGAGILISIGVIAFGVDLYPAHSRGPGWAGFAFCALAVGVGLVLIDRLPTLLESTGVAMVAIGVAAAMGFVQFPRVHSVADLRLFFAVTIVAWVAAFAVGPAKARPLLLALALLTALTWATVEESHVSSQTQFPFGVSQSFSSSPNPDGSRFVVGSDGTITPGDSSGSGDFSFDQPIKPPEPNLLALGALSLAFGIVYLFGAAFLDIRGRRGVATAAIVPGVVAMIDAVIFFGEKADNIVVAGLLSVAAGLFVGAIGTQSHRRFTVWIGAFGATVGAVILTTKIADSATGSGSNSHAGSVFGAFTILFGAAMVLVAILVARALGEPSSGDDQPAVAPPFAPAAPAAPAAPIPPAAGAAPPFE